jgi:hypothetical protein
MISGPSCEGRIRRDILRVGVVVHFNEANLALLLSFCVNYDEWMIAATFAHVAFWDQSCVARWNAYDADGSFVDIPMTIINIVNAANLPTWKTLSGKDAVGLYAQVSQDFNDRVANLSEAAKQAAAARRMHSMLDRAGHRNEHAIEVAAKLNLYSIVVPHAIREPASQP